MISYYEYKLDEGLRDWWHGVGKHHEKEYASDEESFAILEKHYQKVINGFLERLGIPRIKYDGDQNVKFAVNRILSATFLLHGRVDQSSLSRIWKAVTNAGNPNNISPRDIEEIASHSKSGDKEYSRWQSAYDWTQKAEKEYFDQQEKYKKNIDYLVDDYAERLGVDPDLYYNNKNFAWAINKVLTATYRNEGEVDRTALKIIWNAVKAAGNKNNISGNDIENLAPKSGEYKRTKGANKWTQEEEKKRENVDVLSDPVPVVKQQVARICNEINKSLISVVKGFDFKSVTESDFKKAIASNPKREKIYKTYKILMSLLQGMKNLDVVDKITF